MRTLWIPLGNRLRRDDGVAHAVLQLLRDAFDLESRPLLLLTPEVADEIASYAMVIFLDADASAADLSIEVVEELRSPPALTHFSTPAQIVELSRALFGFEGRAFVCRIPANDLSFGEGLSRDARAVAARAAAELEILLGGLGSFDPVFRCAPPLPSGRYISSPASNG